MLFFFLVTSALVVEKELGLTSGWWGVITEYAYTVGPIRTTLQVAGEILLKPEHTGTCKAGSTWCMVRICDASCVMIRASCVWKNVSNLRRCVIHSFVTSWFDNLAVNWHIKANYMCQIRQIFLNTFTHDIPRIVWTQLNVWMQSTHDHKGTLC